MIEDQDQDQDRAHAAKPICVLKFGSSVLSVESDYPAAAMEVYRHVREGEKVVAVVSALAGQTDALLDQASRVGGEPPAALTARLARVGELHSAALMALALNRIGVPACTIDPEEMGLVAEGEALDANLTGLDVAAVLAKLSDHEAVVVPGFTATHAEHGVVTLGRGGTDLSAVFFADRLGAHRARLIKDVDGVYTRDPAKFPDAERFAELDYARAAEASAGLIQPKAIDAAAAAGVTIEIATIGAGEETRIADLPVRTALPHRARPMRITLLGGGAVGGGVLSYLKTRPDLFEINPVLVRDAARYGAGHTADAATALAGADVVIEATGGADAPLDMLCAALRSGADVVSANKAVVAKHHEALQACAEGGGGRLLYSSAVGGAVPILEAIARAGNGVTAIEGVMNGTCNFLLGRLAEGGDFASALARAQELGFAEADPSADVDGHDAADKLSLLIRAAFAIALSPERIDTQSLAEVTPERVAEAAARGEVLKQVGRCRLLADGGVEASVTVEALPAADFLAGAVNEENRFRLIDAAGHSTCLAGKGAGRWPTAASVFADVMDLQRAFIAGQGAAAPLRIRA